jgi:predicted ester cyclase
MSVRTDVARKALHALAAGELPLFQSFFAETFVFHTQRHGKPTDRAALPDRALLLTSTLHDATLTIELVMEDGDLVAVRWRGRAVHRGDLLGIPATGARVETTGITIFRFAGDLIAEEWTEFDGLGLLGQIAPGRHQSAGAPEHRSA